MIVNHNILLRRGPIHWGLICVILILCMTTPHSPEQRAYIHSEIQRIHALLQRGGNEQNENARKAIEKELNMREIEAWQGFERLVRSLDADLQKSSVSESFFDDLLGATKELLSQADDLASEHSEIGQYLVNLLLGIQTNAEIGNIEYLQEDMEELRRRID